MIDDGVAGRGHRTNLLNPEFTVTGNFSGDHSQYNTMTCCTFAMSFLKPGESQPAGAAVSGGSMPASGGSSGMDAKMQAFMKEEVKFKMPAGATGWN